MGLGMGCYAGYYQPQVVFVGKTPIGAMVKGWLI